MADDIVKRILLELNLNSEDTKNSLDSTIKKTAEYTDANQKLKDSLEDLEAQGKKDTEEFKKLQRQYDDNGRTIKVLTKETKSLENQLVNLEKANRSETGSLAQKRSALSAASAEYARYSEEQKKTNADAIALGKSITDLTEDLKAEEKALGDNRRNVGNYAGAVKDAMKEVERMTQAFGENSSQAREAQRQYGLAKDKLADFKAEAATATAEGKFAAFTKLGATLAGGLSAATGAMALFGVESEDTQKALLKVQAAMALTTGLKELAALPDVLAAAKVAMQGLAVASRAALGPIALIATTVGAVALAVNAFGEETTDYTRVNMGKQLALVQNRYDEEIRLLRAAGKETYELQLAALANQEKIELEKAKALQQKSKGQTGLFGIRTNRGLSEEEQKQFSDAIAAANEYHLQFRELQISHNKKVEDEEKKSNERKVTEVKKYHQEVKDLDTTFKGELFANAAEMAQEIAAKRQEFGPSRKDLEAQNNLILEGEVALAQMKLQASADAYDTQKQLDLVNAQERLELARTAEEQQYLVKQEYANKRNQIEENAKQRDLATARGFAATIGGLFKKQSAEYKAFAIAEALISTYSAISKTLSAFSQVPIPGYAIAQSILIGLQGFAQVKNISGVQFYDGGYTGDGNPREVSTALGPKPYVYHKNEYVTPAWMVDDPKIRPIIHSLEQYRMGNPKYHSSLSGYASGGFAPSYNSTVVAQQSRNIEAQFNQAQLLDAFRTMPAPVVTVEDINTVQQSVRVTESRAVS